MLRGEQGTLRLEIRLLVIVSGCNWCAARGGVVALSLLWMKWCVRLLLILIRAMLIWLAGRLMIRIGWRLVVILRLMRWKGMLTVI